MIFSVRKVVVCSFIMFYFIPEKNIENYLLFDIGNLIIIHQKKKNLR